jgi:pimeloyl-ACP methyl ester carboxylesterase
MILVDANLLLHALDETPASSSRRLKATGERMMRRAPIALLLLGLTVAALPAHVHAQAADDTAIRPFTIQVSDAVLADLQGRLARARIPEPLQGDGWTLGTDVASLKQLVAHWHKGFDWRRQERELNRMEQFTTVIDGLRIHFVHRRSPNAGALPLIVTHGWPGSIAEFTKIIGPLTDPAAHGGAAEDAFHVVMPSIPGFAFSEKPREPGFSPARIAGLFVKLMERLGYARYGAQGGDWGSIISSQIALADPARVAGLHLNMCISGPPPGDANAGLTEAEIARLKRRQAFQAEETGYQQIQGTKPQTIGIALNESPVALAAWILEKFQSWCDCDGDPTRVFTRDELLTNIMLYWVTETAASSARIYYESRHAPPAPPRRIEVPTACADFPREVIWSPRRWLEARYNITRWTAMPRGGHFAAMEQPALLVQDVREFFRGLRR